jgi:serine/threonine protein kinase
MASHSIPIDFSNVRCGYSTLEISAYPQILQPTVTRIRTLVQSKVHVYENDSLGFGSYGKIFKAFYDTQDSQRVFCAIKVFMDRDTFEHDCWSEAQMHWKCIGNPYTVKFHGVLVCRKFSFFEEPRPNAILLDAIDSPNLYRSLESETFRKTEAVQFAHQLFSYLAHLKTTDVHRPQSLVHADLELTNLFWVDKKLTVIDFSIMFPMAKACWPIVQKAHIRAPELFLNQMVEDPLKRETIRYTESIDMWAAAICIHEFATGTHWNKEHFSDNAPHGTQQISYMVHRLGMPAKDLLSSNVASTKFFDLTGDAAQLKPELKVFHEETSLEEMHKAVCEENQKLMELVRKVLVWDPGKRPTPEQALTDPVFKGLSD